MLDFPIELARTNELLSRIADALDRLAPVIPVIDHTLYQAKLTDLHYATPESIQEQDLAGREFASREQVVYNSPAYFERLRLAHEMELQSLAGRYGTQAHLENLEKLSRQAEASEDQAKHENAEQAGPSSPV